VDEDTVIRPALLVDILSIPEKKSHPAALKICFFALAGVVEIWVKYDKLIE
jgi:hypothetical protein